MISLIIPFYNCKRLADNTMKILSDYLKSNTNIEIIAVNDGSTDGTLEALKIHQSERIKIVTYSINKGKGYAIKEGIFVSNGDKIIFTDADLAYGLEPILQFAEALNTFDVVAGTRRGDIDISANYGLLRALSSNLFSLITQLILKLDIDDTQCGFKGYRTDVAKDLFSNLSINEFGFDLDILAMAKNSGYSIIQVPVTLLKNEKQTTVRLLRDGSKMIRDMLSIRKKLKRKNI